MFRLLPNGGDRGLLIGAGDESLAASGRGLLAVVDEGPLVGCSGGRFPEQ